MLYHKKEINSYVHKKLVERLLFTNDMDANTSFSG